jgi:hypothetical protein
MNNITKFVIIPKINNLKLIYKKFLFLYIDKNKNISSITNNIINDYLNNKYTIKYLYKNVDFSKNEKFYNIFINILKLHKKNSDIGYLCLKHPLLFYDNIKISIFKYINFDNICEYHINYLAKYNKILRYYIKNYDHVDVKVLYRSLNYYFVKITQNTKNKFYSNIYWTLFKYKKYEILKSIFKLFNLKYYLKIFPWLIKYNNLKITKNIIKNTNINIDENIDKELKELINYGISPYILEKCINNKNYNLILTYIKTLNIKKNIKKKIKKIRTSHTIPLNYYSINKSINPSINKSNLIKNPFFKIDLKENTQKINHFPFNKHELFYPNNYKDYIDNLNLYKYKLNHKFLFNKIINTNFLKIKDEKIKLEIISLYGNKLNSRIYNSINFKSIPKYLFNNKLNYTKFFYKAYRDKDKNTFNHILKSNLLNKFQLTNWIEYIIKDKNFHFEEQISKMLSNYKFNNINYIIRLLCKNQNIPIIFLSSILKRNDIKYNLHYYLPTLYIFKRACINEIEKFKLLLNDRRFGVDYNKIWFHIKDHTFKDENYHIDFINENKKKCYIKYFLLILQYFYKLNKKTFGIEILDIKKNIKYIDKIELKNLCKNKIINYELYYNLFH